MPSKGSPLWPTFERPWSTFRNTKEQLGNQLAQLPFISLKRATAQKILTVSNIGLSDLWPGFHWAGMFSAGDLAVLTFGSARGVDYWFQGSNGTQEIIIVAAFAKSIRHMFLQRVFLLIKLAAFLQFSDHQGNIQQISWNKVVSNNLSWQSVPIFSYLLSVHICKGTAYLLYISLSKRNLLGGTKNLLLIFIF